MVKTKFVFAVSLVAMLAVSSAWANAPASGESVGEPHGVYEDPLSENATGIAGVSYVNKAVNVAGASAQAAEEHAAAAGQSALNAAESAAEAAASAQSANNALVNKQDKSTAVKVATSGTAVGSATVPVYVDDTGTVKPITSYNGNAASATKATQDGNGKVIADTYATKAQVDSLGNTQSDLVNDVNELKTGKQDVLGYTAENSANKVTSVSSDSTDAQYPSAKAMYTALSDKQATISDLAEIRSGAAAGATALQKADIATGTSNGTISVEGTDVAVKGLGSAAFTASTAYATAAQGALAASAVQPDDLAEVATTGSYNDLSDKPTIPSGALASKSTITNADVADNAAIAQSKISGLTSALSGKQATISDLADIRSGAAAGATAVQDLGDLGVTATAAELNYVDGVTSNIQTQLNNKQAKLTVTGSANRPVYAVDGGVAPVTGMSIPYGAESNPSSWATIWVE